LASLFIQYFFISNDKTTLLEEILHLLTILLSKQVFLIIPLIGFLSFSSLPSAFQIYLKIFQTLRNYSLFHQYFTNLKFLVSSYLKNLNFQQFAKLFDFQISNFNQYPSCYFSFHLDLRIKHY
jgi:hypothetical protein